MTEFRDFEPGGQFPAWFVAKLQDFLSGLSNVVVRVKPTDATVLQLPAGPESVSVAIAGKWRFVAATIERASPGGVARDLDVFVTAADDAFSTTSVDLGAGPVPVEQDNTDRSFDLAIVESGATPAGVALSRRVAVAHWDGAVFAGVTRVAGAETALFEPEVPVGTLRMSVLPSQDPGWMLVMGQAVTAAAAPRLRSRLLAAGSPHGVDGSGNPLLPEPGRALVIAGQGAGLTNRVLGAKFGEETHLLSAAESGSPAHTHPDNIAYAAAGSHAHSFTTSAQYAINPSFRIPYSDTSWAPFRYYQGSLDTVGNIPEVPAPHGVATLIPAPHAHTGTTDAGGSHSHVRSGGVLPSTSADAASEHNNVQPSVAVSVFVKI